MGTLSMTIILGRNVKSKKADLIVGLGVKAAEANRVRRRKLHSPVFNKYLMHILWNYDLRLSLGNTMISV